MTEKKLRYFIIVAECQNISKAARELFVAQPALSKMIAALEEEVGYPLFDRNGKNIVLNKNGKILYEYGRRILGEYENVRSALAEANQQKAAPLRIGVCVSSQILATLLSQFKKENEKLIPIQVKSRFPLEFDRDEVDLIIDARMEPVEQDEQHHLLSERILLALPKGHPLLKRDHISLADTGDYPYILPSENTRMGIMLKKFFQEQDLPYPVNATIVNNSYEQCELISLGLGISLIPEKSWIYAKKLDEIVLCPLTDVSLERHIFFRYHPNRYQSKELKIFGRFLQKFYQGEQFAGNTGD